MTSQLEEIFGELGISQYLDAFIDQGFDTWETILDITESDLDALGVKLGHRRKLQRRIANFRGIAPETSLVSPTQPSVEDARLDGLKPEGFDQEVRDSAAPATVTKRKYRRHPKPDENAPERPPSAYVLFSNKMRDDLKGRNLTFTEIAKLVGENWQNLAQAEKEPFESQAQAAKDKYNHDLNEYKKTTEYKNYASYLAEFKVKHAHQFQDKDASKRVKLSESSSSGSPGPSASATPNLASRSSSGVDGQLNGEHAGPRHQPHPSATPVGSAAEPHFSAIGTPPLRNGTVGDVEHSPGPRHPRARASSEMSLGYAVSPQFATPTLARQGSSWPEDHREESHRAQQYLPSLTDVFERQRANGVLPPAETNGYPFPSSPRGETAAPPPGLVGGRGRPASLTKEPSSNSSVSSGSVGYPRTPIDGSLPIHALLSSKPSPPYETPQAVPLPVPSYNGHTAGRDTKSPHAFQPALPTPPAAPFTNGYHTSSQPQSHQHQSGPQLTSPYSAAASAPSTAPGPAKPESGLDGMSALLRAGEVLNRRT